MARSRGETQSGTPGFGGGVQLAPRAGSSSAPQAPSHPAARPGTATRRERQAGAVAPGASGACHRASATEPEARTRAPMRAAAAARRRGAGRPLDGFCRRVGEARGAPSRGAPCARPRHAATELACAGRERTATAKGRSPQPAPKARTGVNPGRAPHSETGNPAARDVRPEPNMTRGRVSRTATPPRSPRHPGYWGLGFPVPAGSGRPLRWVRQRTDSARASHLVAGGSVRSTGAGQVRATLSLSAGAAR